MDLKLKQGYESTVSLRECGVKHSMTFDCSDNIDVGLLT